MNFPLSSSIRRLSVSFFILFLFGGTTSLLAQVQIWGVSENGGADGIGTIFSLYDDGAGYTISHSFVNNKEGKHPRTRLATSPAGDLFGITSSGGTLGAGTIFRMGDEFSKLEDLDPDIHGTDAKGDLLFLPDGSFITTTSTGGANGGGVLLQYSEATGLSVLHSFGAGDEGTGPTGGLAYDGNNDILYGSCSNGGDGGAGTVFSYDFDSDITTLHSFDDAADGNYPQGGVILGDDGILYGTTQSGGAYTQGTIFSLNSETSEHTVLHSFNGLNSDGRYPFGDLSESSPGVFIGTCSEGGNFGTGTIFKFETDGTFTKLHDLSASVDGGFPKTGVLTDGSGLAYGVTEFGAANGFGSFYSITEEGVFTKITDFEYLVEGSNPVAELTFTSTGDVAGNCSSGGANDFGTIFIYDGSSLSKIHDFSLPLEGADPAGLVSDGSSFYGVTSSGGIYNDGVFFQSDQSGMTTKLHDFDGSMEGRNPNGALLLQDDGTIYGTTKFGGLGESGTIYSITTEGDYTLIHGFDPSGDGQYPYSGLCRHSDGNLYGTTLSGGIYGDGVIYKIDTDNTYSVVYELFSFFDGAAPEAGLTDGGDGKLYGVTTTGGNFNAGTLFEYDPAVGVPMVLHHFDPNTEGGAPSATLYLHSDGYLYGATNEGLLGGGSLFRFSPLSGIEVLHMFDPAADGYYVTGSFAEDTEGTIYGFASQGGEFGSGTSFNYDSTNGFEKLKDFSSSESGYPRGTPVLLFPECVDDGDCVASEACAVARCVFGVCEETVINPTFTALEIGFCQTGEDIYDLSFSMELDISPGGTFTIAGQSFELDPEETSYTFEITSLPATGEAIDLSYEFEATGCTGTTGSLGQAPEPCPPVEITFILDLGGMEAGEAGLFIGGNFQSWIPAENPMTETAPGTWEATLGMSAGEYEFNFFNGPGIFDAEYVIGGCAQNGKRQLNVGTESDTLSFCWSLCDSVCSTDGISNFKVSQFKLFPNLLNRGESMRATWNHTNGETYRYRIIDSAGKTVDAGTLPNSGDASIGTQQWSSGMNVFIIETSDYQPLNTARFGIR